MNFQVRFNKQVHYITQDFPNYYDLQDQLKTNVPSLPDLFSVVFVGLDNNKMMINDQSDLEALYHLGKDYQMAILEIQDLNEDIFNMGIEETKQKQHQTNTLMKEETNQMDNATICSQCQTNLTVGVYYGCSVCPNILICEKCANFIEHQHALTKNNIHPNASPHFLNQTLGISGMSEAQQSQYHHLIQQQGSTFTQKSMQETTILNATCLEQLFGISYDNALQFVEQNPGLSQEQLISLAIQMQKQ